MSEDAPITQVIRRYYPEWDPPEDDGDTWIKCLCPFHAESRPSAAVSFEHNGFRCMACGAGGDLIKIIMDNEEVKFAEAKRIAEGIHVGGHIPVQGRSTRKYSRPVFGEQGHRPRGRAPVRPGLRERSTPWS